MQNATAAASDSVVTAEALFVAFKMRLIMHQSSNHHHRKWNQDAMRVQVLRSSASLASKLTLPSEKATNRQRSVCALQMN